MKLLVSMFLFFNISVLYAADGIYFTEKSPLLTIEQAISALEDAAKRRKWTPTRLENNTVEVKLDHQGYKTHLVFSFSGNGIYYTDLTTYDETDYDDDEDAKANWVKQPAPRRWVSKLKRETERHLQKYRSLVPTKQKTSHEEIEAKLRSLKKMFDDQLITESEYQQKKKEIMSRY